MKKALVYGGGRFIGSHIVKLITDILGKSIMINNIQDPEGVRGRNSDNNPIYSKLKWKPTSPLKKGLEQTYEWIDSQVRMTLA